MGDSIKAARRDRHSPASSRSAFGLLPRRRPSSGDFLARAKKQAVPYWLLAPALLLLLLFSVYPFTDAIRLSLTDTEWLGSPSEFVGLENYRRLAEQTGTAVFFRQALMNSFTWTFGVVFGQLVLGLTAAMVLNQRFRGRAFFRTAVLVPIAIPSIMHILTWQWMYDPSYGLINHYLRLMGLVEGPQAWVKRGDSSVWPLIIVGIWLGFPFMGLMLLSGLQGLRDDFYEAAMVDGAGTLQKFFYITLPQLRPIIVIAVILHTLWWWNHFDTVMILGTTSGFEFNQSTATLPILGWFEAFRWNNLARGAAISVFSMVVLAAIMFWNARRELRSVNE